RSTDAAEAAVGGIVSGGGPDVLVHAEQVGRIVFLLERGEAIVVVAIGRLYAGVAFVVHHEVDVAAARIEAMQRLPIGFGPARHRPSLLRVRIDPGDDHRPGGIPGAPRRFFLADAVDGAVDWI